MGPSVVAVNQSPDHAMRKPSQPVVRMVAGLGIEGDVHAGASIQHRSRLGRAASQPNLRQVHLIATELHDELRAAGFDLGPGEMGENVTTSGLDLLALPAGTRLRLGDAAVVEITGLRTPCSQLDGVRPGLMAAVSPQDEHGHVVRRAGVMSIVVASGDVRPGDPIIVELPSAPHRPLPPV